MGAGELQRSERDSHTAQVGLRTRHHATEHGRRTTREQTRGTAGRLLKRRDLVDTTLALLQHVRHRSQHLSVRHAELLALVRLVGLRQHASRHGVLRGRARDRSERLRAEQRVDDRSQRIAQRQDLSTIRGQELHGAHVLLGRDAQSTLLYLSTHLPVHLVGHLDHGRLLAAA